MSFHLIQSSSTLNNLLHLPYILNSSRQILMPGLRNQYIILDPHAPHSPIPVQDIKVDVLGVYGVTQVGFDYEAAEIDLFFL